MPDKNIRLLRLNKILFCINDNKIPGDGTFKILLKMLSDEIAESFNKREDYYTRLCEIYSHVVGGARVRPNTPPQEIQAANAKLHSWFCENLRAAVEQEKLYLTSLSGPSAVAG